ncbi:MAG: response regulator [Lachnospiraceae bacterium]|nr:response regulator [Lachnospiraceae bacterium]
MGEEIRQRERQKISHLVILVSYTILTLALTCETVLLGWEYWMIPILFFFLGGSWVLHVLQILPERSRMWIYVWLMMCVFFFYGIHETSIFDLAPLMCVVIMIYSMTGAPGPVIVGMFTYFLTMIYDFTFEIIRGYRPDSLVISRTMLHFMLVIMAGYLARFMILRQRNDRKKYEERIGELESINQRTEDFLANVSHELRTPINVVTGITGVMLKRERNAENREQLSSVRDAGRRLYETIEDILDYTEIDTGRVTVSAEPYLMDSIINDLITENRQFMIDGDCEAIFDVAPEIPAQLIGDGVKIKKILRHLLTNAVKFSRGGGVYVRVTALKKNYGVNLCLLVEDTGIGMSREETERITESFYQADSGRNRAAGGLGLGLSIVNGLTRAMDGFIQIESQKGKGTSIRLSIPQGVADDSPCMSVADKEHLCLACYLRPEKYEIPEIRDYYNALIANLVNGLGVSLHRVNSQEDLEKLMEVYQITHIFIGREEYEGNTTWFETLDESISVVVVANDGFVPRNRTRVRVLRKPFCGVPIAMILNADSDLSEFDLSSEKQMYCPGVRALVVDDETMNLMVAEGVFRDYGMTVRTALSGEEALRVCAEEEFDVIFMDHMMPGMDGVETMKQLRRQRKSGERRRIIIALTANAVSGAREMFLSEGFDGFIPKPIELMELERVLKRLLPEEMIQYAEQDKSAREEKDEVLKALDAYGINTREGIGYCRNDRAFYRELLLRFAKDMEAKKKEIEDCYDKGDWEGYRIRVHALKSTAKMIGADRLSELARKAEDASRTKDIPYLKSHGGELMEIYEDAAFGIEGVMSNSMEEARDAGTEIAMPDYLKRLRELKERLDTFEAERAEELLNEMAGFRYEGKPLSESLGEISVLVGDFALAEASEKTGELIGSIQGGHGS